MKIEEFIKSEPLLCDKYKHLMDCINEYRQPFMTLSYQVKFRVKENRRRKTKLK